MGLLTGCTDDDLKNGGNVIEGVPVTVSLKVSCSPNAEVVVDSRADNSLSDIGNDLTIFIFDGSGNFQKAVSTYDNTLEVAAGNTTDRGVTFTTKFETTSGTKKLLAAGNLWSNYWYTEENIATLNDINTGKYTFDQVKEMLYEIAYVKASGGEYMPISITSGEQMPVSGYNEGVVFDTGGNVTDWGNASYSDVSQNVAVRMKRALASITFNIKAGNVGNGEFVPTRYQVYNLPIHSYMVNMDGRGHPDNYTEYINYAEMNTPAVSGGNYTFQFYMPGNIYGETDGVAGYHQREAWTGATGAGHGSKTWTNAPQNSTFVVIQGTYSGKADVNGVTTDVSASVEYTIHLGDFSTATGSMGNFSVERNCAYTYNVTVNGVDNIIVEALKTDPDKYQHGAEGVVYDTNNMSYDYNLDAHYEQVFLEYNLSSIARSLSAGLSGFDLDREIAAQLILVIQSPAMPERVSSIEPYRIYAEAADKTAAKADALDGKIDYKWIEFWPQTDEGIATYPGVSSWARESLDGMKNQDYYGTATSDAQYLMDAYDILVDMGNTVKKIYNGETVTTGSRTDDCKILVSSSGSDYVARFTAFVDEFYWLKNPVSGAAVTWAEFTNTIPREMIIAMSSDVSDDGNSSYQKIHSSISQLSLQTFYDGTNPEISAFGLETYNETPVNTTNGIVWGTPKATSNLSDTDGRSNQITLIGGGTGGTVSATIRWSDFISAGYNGWTSSDNTTTDHTVHKLSSSTYREGAYAACLSRNRDLDGDGVIDDNEVRWFLASIGGYIRIGAGSNAISSEAQLYIGDKTHISQSGYATNYIMEGSLFYTSSSDEKRLYWAVEKGSFGPDGVSWVGGDTRPKPIRCLRTLPASTGTYDLSSVSGVTSSPLYEKTDGSGTGTGRTPNVLKFKGRLLNTLYRQRVNTSLSAHNEDGNANSFYDGIFVAENVLSGTYKLGDLTGLNGTMTNPCSGYSEGQYDSGWRVPNLVELIAMYFAGYADTAFITCCTQSSTAGNPVRYGFGIDYSNQLGFIMTAWGDRDGTVHTSISSWDNAWPDHRVRCVRDVPAGYFN